MSTPVHEVVTAYEPRLRAAKDNPAELARLAAELTGALIQRVTQPAVRVVLHAAPYALPAENPLVTTAQCPLIYVMPRAAQADHTPREPAVSELVALYAAILRTMCRHADKFQFLERASVPAYQRGLLARLLDSAEYASTQLAAMPPTVSEVVVTYNKDRGGGAEVLPTFTGKPRRGRPPKMRAEPHQLR